MVCDGATVAGTIVSLMMNGVCCLWQQQEEKERRETIRRDIRAEYWHQRLIDHELLMQRKRCRVVAIHRDGDDCNSVPDFHDRTSFFIQEKRRKKLLQDKGNASNNSPKDVASSSQSPVSRDNVVSVLASPRTGKTYHRISRRRALSSPLARPSYDMRQDKKLKTIEQIDRPLSLADSDSDDEVNSLSSSFTEVCLH